MLMLDDFTTIQYRGSVELDKDKQILVGILSDTLSLQYNVETMECYLCDTNKGYVDSQNVCFAIQPDIDTLVVVYENWRGRLILCDVDDYIKLDSILISQDGNTLKVKSKSIGSLLFNVSGGIRVIGKGKKHGKAAYI